MRKNQKHDGDTVLKFSEHKQNRVDELEAEVDELFRLPLAEFTGARNALAAWLKKSGRVEDKAEAARVKALNKPSISAWAVNQLYWNHREAFDRLIASAERFHKAQTARSAGKGADMREALDARRECLSQLSDIAASLLRNAGHNPAPDTIHRVTTTLEGISAYASRSDAPPPGRLTADVDPPGFELFGSSIPSAGMERQKAVGEKQASRTKSQESKTRRTRWLEDDARHVEETRKAKIAAAKVSLQDAKRSLTQARTKAQSLEAAQKRADSEAKRAEKQRRDAEESLEKAKAAAEAAAARARSVAVEVEEAASAVEDAELMVKESSQELEGLFGE